MAAAASSSVVAATKRLAPPFNLGKTKVYLPSHVVTFIRPKLNQGPNFATFLVPLSFNKLDLRDYLWHVYSVRVLSVRSMVAQQALQTRGREGRGQVYRPRSQKYMIVQLASPFVWPDPPAEDEREEFDYDIYKPIEDAREDSVKTQRERNRFIIPLRTEQEVPTERKALAEEARALLQGRVPWKNGIPLDQIWARGQAKAAREAGGEEGRGSPLLGEQKDTDIILEDDKPSGRP